MSEIEVFERFANLEQHNLTGYSLSGYDLTGASLRHTILKDADLSYTTLKLADLSYADLRMANLKNADLSGVNLINTDLRGADLRGTKLKNTNFEDAKIEEATLGFLNFFYITCKTWIGTISIFGILFIIVIFLSVSGKLRFEDGNKKELLVNKCNLTKTYNVESK